MKKSFFSVAVFLVAGLVFSGVVFAQGKKIPAGGTAIWDHLKKEGYAKKWKMWPGTTAMYPGPEPHGAFLTTYVNDAAYKAIADKKGKFPDGAMITQDNFTKDKKLKTIDVMYKVKGYNPKGGDWFWAQFRTDGRILSEGKIDECIACHAAQKRNDYVYTGKLK
jgi:hypothetical protein